jgi:hypothetical protein
MPSFFIGMLIIAMLTVIMLNVAMMDGVALPFYPKA